MAPFVPEDLQRGGLSLGFCRRSRRDLPDDRALHSAAMLSGFGLYEEEHHAFRRTVRAVVEKHILPYVRDWEEKGEFPRSLFKTFAAEGFLGLKYAEEYGGTNAGLL